MSPTRFIQSGFDERRQLGRPGDPMSVGRVESCALGLVPFDVGCAVFVDLDCEALVV
jgi:hypothetical protein